MDDRSLTPLDEDSAFSGDLGMNIHLSRVSVSSLSHALQTFLTWVSGSPGSAMTLTFYNSSPKSTTLSSASGEWEIGSEQPVHYGTR